MFKNFLANKILFYMKTEPVLMVSVFLALFSMIFVKPSKEYMSYIDFKTIACLFCLMTSVGGMKNEGVLKSISFIISEHLKSTRSITFFLVFSCYFFSMFVTNDVALITIVPITFIVLSECNMADWSRFIVVLQTIAANIGSGLTPFGNPQNLFLYSKYNMNVLSFLLAMLPIVIFGGIILSVCCLFVTRENIIQEHKSELKMSNKKNICVYLLLFILSIFAVFGYVNFLPAVCIVIMAVFFIDVSLLKKIDYTLILTFMAIFIFVGNIGKISCISNFISAFVQKNSVFSAVFFSQIISNVPAAILLSRFTNNGYDLLIGSNIGGLGTLIASMASVISYKFYAAVYPKQIYKYLKLFTFLNILFLLILSVFFLIYKYLLM